MNCGNVIATNPILVLAGLLILATPNAVIAQDPQPNPSPGPDSASGISTPASTAVDELMGSLNRVATLGEEFTTLSLGITPEARETAVKSDALKRTSFDAASAVSQASVEEIIEIWGKATVDTIASHPELVALGPDAVKFAKGNLGAAIGATLSMPSVFSAGEEVGRRGADFVNKWTAGRPEHEIVDAYVRLKIAEARLSIVLGDAIVGVAASGVGAAGGGPAGAVAMTAIKAATVAIIRTGLEMTVDAAERAWDRYYVSVEKSYWEERRASLQESKNAPTDQFQSLLPPALEARLSPDQRAYLNFFIALDHRAWHVNNDVDAGTAAYEADHPAYHADMDAHLARARDAVVDPFGTLQNEGEIHYEGWYHDPDALGNDLHEAFPPFTHAELHRDLDELGAQLDRADRLGGDAVLHEPETIERSFDVLLDATHIYAHDSEDPGWTGTPAHTALHSELNALHDLLHSNDPNRLAQFCNAACTTLHDQFHATFVEPFPPNVNGLHDNLHSDLRTLCGSFRMLTGQDCGNCPGR